MFRIDSPGSVPPGLFSEGDPQTAQPATVVSADWLNAVQGEIVNAVEAAGLVLNKADSTQLLQAIRTLQAGGASNPNGIGVNALINGDWGIFQRATSAPSGVLTRALGAAVTAYCFDRWQSASDGGGGSGTATVTRQAHTPGQTNVPGFPLWFGRHQQTVAATVSSPALRQKVENVAAFGGTVTFSAWVKADAGRNVTLRLTQNFGSGGSADVIAGSLVFAATTSWQRVIFTVALASVTGKTFGAGHCLVAEFLMPTGATFTFDFSDVQLEAEPTASAFQRRGRAAELILARRYFEKSWSPDTAAATCPAALDGASIDQITLNPASGLHELMRRFLVEKRAVPTITWYAPSTQVTGRVDYDGADVSVSSTTDLTANATGYPVLGGGATGKRALAHWAADAEL